MGNSNNMSGKEDKLHRCTTMQCNSATFDVKGAIPDATPVQSNSLLALSSAVLERNTQCNTDATPSKNECNFLPGNTFQKLHGFDVVEDDDLFDKERQSLCAKNKLTMIADSLKYPVDDLIDFYQNDMPDIARMDDDAVAFIVRDYIQYREACRCKPENELNEAT